MAGDDGRVRSRRRWLWWLAASVFVVAWLVAAGPAGSSIGKLADVQKNDNAAFLPASSESTTVQQKAAKFTDSDAIPAIVVYHRAPKLTSGDLAKIRGQARDLHGWRALAGRVVGPQVSKDGSAAELVVPLDSGSDHKSVVSTLRDRTSGDAGLSVHTAGPAGLTADLAAAFGGIDGTLLLVSGVLVLLILVVVYRSPILPLVVLSTALLALSVAGAAVYQLADHGVIDLNGQSQGILFILVIGACTDYALLLVARQREELRHYPDRFTALRAAYRAAIAPIVASGGTVILGLLCLLATNLKSTSGLGPVAAIGIGASLLAALTFLPAVLALLGRGAFWPAVPRYGTDQPERNSLWARIADRVGRRPRLGWITVTVVLVALAAAFLPQFRASGTAQTDVFLKPQDSVAGQDVIAAHFPAGSGAPTMVISSASDADRVAAAIRSDPGVDGGSVAPVSATGAPGGKPKVIGGQVLIEATLRAAPDSDRAVDTVHRLRDRLHPMYGAVAQVGGYSAVQADTVDTSRHDQVVVIPLVLIVILLVLIALLRALVAPLLLIASVVVSFAATLGVAAVVFNHLLGFPGADPAVPLLTFVFLVALGVDYNIFLMSRVREETLRSNTRDGTLAGLRATGGVITCAGIVLAATFAALSVVPLLFLAQLAFLVAFGVLLDTFLVRTLLVPSLIIDIGRHSWWPSRLSRRHDPAPGTPAPPRTDGPV